MQKIQNGRVQQAIEIAERFQEGDPEAGIRLEKLGAGVIAWFILSLEDARKFRGNGKTHTVCEHVRTGECWICGNEG